MSNDQTSLITNLESKETSAFLKFGMPTLIETDTLEECAILCRDLGLSFIELSMSLPQYTLDTIDPEHFRHISRRYGLFYTIHLDENVNFFDFNTLISNACLRYITETVSLSKKLGAPLINMHFHRGEHFTLPDRKVDLFDIYRDHYMNKVQEFRRACEDAVGDSEITISVENCSGFADFQKEALSILLDSPVFSLTFDIGHNHGCGGTDEGYIMENKHHLRHMHMHDAVGRKDHLALGSGEVDIQKYLSLAEDQNCSVVLETKTIEGLKQSVNWIRQKGILR